MNQGKLILNGYKTKPEEFKQLIFGYLTTPGEYFIYLKEDEPEIEAMFNNEKPWIEVYDVKIHKGHIVKREPFNDLDSVLNQCPQVLRNELKVRFNKFEQDNSMKPDMANMIDIALQTMTEAKNSIEKATDEDIDKELAEAKAQDGSEIAGKGEARDTAEPEPIEKKPKKKA